jgi:hypothetical protein
MKNEGASSLSGYGITQIIMNIDTNQSSRPKQILRIRNQEVHVADNVVKTN